MSVNGILGKKVGMTQLFDDKGDVRPVTVLQAVPCVVTQLKSLAIDGYEAAQIGLVEFVKDKHVTKAMKGHFEKHDLPPVTFASLGRRVSTSIAIAGKLFVIEIASLPSDSAASA